MSTPIKTDPDKCPFCGAFISAATSAEEAENLPNPGDFTLCLKCDALCTYDEFMKIQKPTPQAMASMCPEEKAAIAEARRALRTFRSFMTGQEDDVTLGRRFKNFWAGYYRGKEERNK